MTPELTITGRLVEVGRLEGGVDNGITLEVSERYITLSGLTETECRIMAAHFFGQITVSLIRKPS